jgi:hypothetical protein
VESNIYIDSESLLMTDFVNLKIKLTQSFGCAHRDRVYVYVFIGVSTHMCINIYIFKLHFSEKSIDHPQFDH